MLGRIKVLEANVQDLYSMCHDEFETNMSSKCYKHCKNLAELIQSLKQDVMSNSLNHPYDKAGYSKMYDKLCNLESDVLELMNSVKPIEPKKFHKTRAPKTGRTCKSCQRKFGLPVNQGNAEKTRYYSRSRRRRVIENDDWSGDNIDHFDRLSYVDLKNGPRARKLYWYPSNESLSTSSSSSSSILVEEYCVVPKEKKENYRIVREGLPFRVEKSKSRNTLNNMRRNSPEFKKLRNRVEVSARKYDPRDIERYYEYKETPRHRKKRKRKHKDMKQGSEIYFVRKTKDPTQSGFNIRDGSKGPNDKYLVSRLRRIPTGDFAWGESSVNTDRGRKYSQSYRGKKCSSDSNNSQTSIESGFIKSKWRRSPDLRKQSRRPMKKEPLFPQNFIVAQSSSVNTTPLSVQRPSCDNPIEHNARRQDNQTYRIRKCKIRDEDFKTKSDTSSIFIVNSNYEVIDSFYGSCLNTEDTRNGKNYLHSKTPLAHSLYVNKAPLYYETSAREIPALINVSSSGHYPNGKRKRMRRKMKPFRGSLNQINVYQIHGQTQSNPFLKNEADNKSSLTVFTSLKESLSFLKPRKSTVNVEALQHNIDYSNNREVGDVNYQQTAPSSRKSIVTSPVAKASKTRLSKTGSKIKNLVGRLSGLRKQDSKNRSQSSFMQSDPNAKEESIYKQDTREDTDSSKLKSDLINSRISGRILVTPSPQVDARNHRLTNNIDINKPSVKGLLYSLRYDKETRQDFECNDWPIFSSLDHFGSNCTTLLSEEKIDLSEHKLNGEHNEVHTHHISPPKTKEANNEREFGRRISPKLTDLKPTSYKEFKDVDWKLIVNELNES